MMWLMYVGDGATTKRVWLPSRGRTLARAGCLRVWRPLSSPSEGRRPSHESLRSKHEEQAQQLLGRKSK